MEGGSRSLHKLPSGPDRGSDESSLHPPSDYKAQYHKDECRDGVVGRETELRAEHLRNFGSVPDTGNRCIFYNVQNGSKAQPFSYLMGNGSSSSGMKLTTDLHLVLRLIMRGSYTATPTYVFMACTGTVLLLYYHNSRAVTISCATGL